MTLRGAILLVGGVATVGVPVGCGLPAQELPVVASATAVGERLEWRDAYGSLRGEVPWVLRSDVRGPDALLMVETPDGDRCARRVTFEVLAPGDTSYTVTLVSDLRGRVAWDVVSGGGQKIRLFSCEPRPAQDERNACVFGGIPRPLSGRLAAVFEVELDDGTAIEGVRSVRFERGSRCGPAGVDRADVEVDPGAMDGG
jgi:hypothetical protein